MVARHRKNITAAVRDMALKIMRKVLAAVKNT